MASASTPSVCLRGWNSMCQPYIECATTLSDVDESIACNDGFLWAPEIDFRYEVEARKVMMTSNLLFYIGKSL